MYRLLRNKIVSNNTLTVKMCANAVHFKCFECDAYPTLDLTCMLLVAVGAAATVAAVCVWAVGEAGVAR